MDQPALSPTTSRRQFLAAIGNLASAGWIAMNWPQIALAAQPTSHAGHDMAAAPSTLKVLNPLEAAQVDAIANQIIPGGDMPGARDARVVYFIDNALGSFFSAQLPAFRQGMAEFISSYAKSHGAEKPFSAASDADQIAWLKTVDETPFFLAVRRLSLLGLIAMPKYGGNHEGLGTKLIGVIDSHFWEPPFGYYDKDYPGFEPFPGTKPYTA